EGIFDLSVGERASHRLTELLADRQRRAWRRDEEIDRCRRELIEAVFLHVRNFWRELAAPFAGHRQPAQAIVADIRKHLGERREEHMNLAAEQPGQRRTAA